MLLGIDLDNTLISYDTLFQTVAREFGISGAPEGKQGLRDFLRAQPGGEDLWQRIQAAVYGPRLGEAVPMPGALEALRRCRERRARAVIVSHKTRFAAKDQTGTDLRTAALAWLEAKGFLGQETGISAAEVFFTDTREEKVERLAACGCTHCIDDLPEVFREPAFPASCLPVLIAPDAPAGVQRPLVWCRTWQDIEQSVLNEPLFGPEAAAARTAMLGACGLEAGCVIMRIGGGRNSRIYRVETPEGRGIAALKVYFRHPADTRDRRAREALACDVFQRAGEAKTPGVLWTDTSFCATAFTWLDGRRPAPGADGAAAVEALLKLFEKLRNAAAAMPPGDEVTASEACFSLEELRANLEARRHRLEAIRPADEVDEAMLAFLRGPFDRHVSGALGAAVEAYATHGLRPTDILPAGERVLSPSDFGLHNMLRSADGDFWFVDFEYFGWDDPAKTLSDFLLHPAEEMALPRDVKECFARGFLELFQEACPSLPWRVGALLPLYAAKWALIILNEFAAQDAQRRNFAATASGVDRRPAQLQKAKMLIENLGAITAALPHPSRLHA